MKLTVDQLLQGKQTLIKEKEFFDTKTYVEPFLDEMGKYTSDFRIEAIEPKQLSITEEPDIVYNRVWIQAVLPEKFFFEDNHKQVVSMLYGLDAKKPVCKLYRGGLNMACTNLCVFNPNMLLEQPIKPVTKLEYKGIDELLKRQDNFKLFLENMKNNYIVRDDRELNLGKWVDFCLKESYSSTSGKIKISASTAIKAYKELYMNENSEYYQTGDTTSMFDVYNAFTQVFTDDKRDILNKFEKTTLLNNLLNL